MRFLLYNLRYGTGTGPRYHLPFPMVGFLKPTRLHLHRIAQFLADMAPDVVGLVEVDSGSLLRCNRRDQAQQIAEELGHWNCVENKYPPRSLARALPMLKKQANAVLSRTPPARVLRRFFDRGMKRLVLDVEYETFRVFLVHLALNRDCRQQQLEQLARWVKSVDKPCLVTGDFNCFGGDAELLQLMRVGNLKNANRGGQPSWPSWAPRHQLDFILHSPGIEVNAFRVPTVQLSDHYPLVCDFTVRVP